MVPELIIKGIRKATQVLDKAAGFLGYSVAGMQKRADDATKKQLDDEINRIKVNLISGNMGFPELAASTVTEKIRLAEKGLISSDPSLPLVRFFNIYNALRVMKQKTGGGTTFWIGVPPRLIYRDKAQPKRKDRTVHQVIEHSKKLGRDIFDERTVKSMEESVFKRSVDAVSKFLNEV